MYTTQVDKKPLRIQVLIALSVLALIACKPKAPEAEGETANGIEQKPATSLYITEEHAAILSEKRWQEGIASIQRLRDKAGELKNQIEIFLKQVDDESLQSAQNAWRETFSAYQGLLPYFSLKHPSLNESLAQWPLALAAYPLQPGYLDSYSVYTQSGLVNDISLSISADSLRKQHQLTDSEEVTLGLYAIEYMLWGDKESRSVELYRAQSKVPLAFAQAGLKVNELPQNRRRALLSLQSELLLNDLDQLLSQWQNGGLLHTLYHQLSPSKRLSAYHQGLYEKLTALNVKTANVQAPVSNEVEVQTQAEKDEGEDKKVEQESNAFVKRATELQALAIKEQAKQIENHYFASTRIRDEKNAISLASSLLTSEEQEAVKALIKTLTDKP